MLVLMVAFMIRVIKDKNGLTIVPLSDLKLLYKPMFNLACGSTKRLPYEAAVSATICFCYTQCPFGAAAGLMETCVPLQD